MNKMEDGIYTNCTIHTATPIKEGHVVCSGGYRDEEKDWKKSRENAKIRLLWYV